MLGFGTISVAAISALAVQALPAALTGQPPHQTQAKRSIRIR